MRVLITLFITAILLTYSSSSFSKKNGSQGQLIENVQSDIRQLKWDAKVATNDVEILRRDQINYRLEKDLLKEAYSSNLETINLVLTIVLGVIGILGYLGIRSIKDVKSEYTNELNELKGLKTKFEVKLEELVIKQEDFESKISDLSKINEEQDNRLKVLELTEKVSALMRDCNWRWALQYISIALDIDQDNVPLLKQKSICHGNLGEFSLAIDTSRKLLELDTDPKGVSAIVVNMLEYLALSNQPNEFANIYAAHKDKVDQYQDGNVYVYLDILCYLIKNDLAEAVNRLSVFAKKFPDITKKFLGENWKFDDPSFVASNLPAGRQKDLLLKTIDFFDGKISSNELETSLAL